MLYQYRNRVPLVIVLIRHVPVVFALAGNAPPPATQLFLHDNGYCQGHKLNTSIDSAGPSVPLTMLIEIILAVELVFAAELARKPVWSLIVSSETKVKFVPI